MSSQLVDGLVNELNDKIGDRTFFTLSELVLFGLFGSLQAARHALRDGLLPSVRISQRRCVIPRAALINYIRANLADKQEVVR
jgi:hypothetical protein